MTFAPPTCMSIDVIYLILFTNEMFYNANFHRRANVLESVGNLPIHCSDYVVLSCRRIAWTLYQEITSIFWRHAVIMLYSKSSIIKTHTHQIWTHIYGNILQHITMFLLLLQANMKPKVSRLMFFVEHKGCMKDS